MSYGYDLNDVHSFNARPAWHWLWYKRLCRAWLLKTWWLRSSHSIEYVSHCLPGWGIWTTCAISVLRNDNKCICNVIFPLQWRHYERAGVSNHQLHDCLLNRLFKRRSENTSKLHVTGICAENSPVTGEFPRKGPVSRKMFPFDDVIMI